MKKRDLKDGMIVQLRDGERLIVLGTFLKGEKSCFRIDMLQENLNHKTSTDFDIVEIKNAIDYYGSIERMFKYFNDLDTIWEREEYNFKPGDKVQVRDVEDADWVNAYFIQKLENDEVYKWSATIKDEFTAGMSFEEMDYKIGAPWVYIRPYKEER